MKLYTYFRSSAAFRVRIALNLKGLTYESIPRALNAGEQRAAECLAVNPQGLVPALATDGVVLSQSLAIIEYLRSINTFYRMATPSKLALPKSFIKVDSWNNP